VLYEVLYESADGDQHLAVYRAPPGGDHDAIARAFEASHPDTRVVEVRIPINRLGEGGSMSHVATAAPDTTKHVQASTILQRAVCLVLECHYLGNYRKARLKDAVQAATGAEQDVDAGVEQQVHLTKKLVDSKELTRAMAVPEAAKAYLRSVAIPAHRVFGERAYLVPLAAVQQVDERLAEFATQARVESQLVAARWDALVTAQERALGPKLFKRDEYPTAAAVAESFRIDWSYVSFSAPERLEHVDHALFAAAQDKYEKRMAAAYDEVKVVLRETLRQVVGEVVKRLAPSDDGKPKVIRGTALSQLSDFLNTFNLRNITDDAELARVVARLKQLTDGVEVSDLRDIDEVRQHVFQGAQSAVQELDKLIVTGRRGIALDGLA
jgi:hypothetical protein